MVGSRERRPRGRKKVHYEEVLPSTDLPPLVQGDLRCFLIVDIGKIHWSSTTTAQVPPASPAYVRLRWWGETSDGTLFKPASARDDRIVKSRCRFGVRSGAKQMSAYFMDMGSIVLEVLTSPKSVPLGRVQIPKVAHLSSDNPICNYFKIISPSSRNVGEIHVRIRFRPLEDAYSMTTDTATDTSMSSRSRPPSEVGRRSRSRGSSVGSRSNIGSARSRSSSGGSRKGRKKRSSSRSKTRGRSRSSESNASSASKRSQQARKASTVDSATPRGIDDMLRMNGHDFYGAETNPRSNAAPVRSDSAQHSDRRTGRRTKGTSGSAEDAISALLKKGNRLREDMMKSQVDSDPAKARIPVFETAIPNKIERPVQPEMPTRHPAVPDSNQAFVPTNMQQVQTIPKTIDPIKEVRQDLDMRFVDLVFGSQEFKGHPGSLSFLSGLVTPPPGSPLGSMISEFEDNPLHDESLLQQMFYNNGASLSAHDMQRVNDKLREIQKVPPDDNQNQQFDAAKTYNVPAKVHFHDQPRAPQVPRILSAIPGLSSRRLQTLHHVHLVRVAIETLKLPPDDISTPSKRRPKKGRGRGSKPPVPSPSRKQKVGTYFVEFKLPVVEENPREHPSSMTTSHEVTRVASRKLLNTEDRTVVFDEVCEFPIQLADANLLKWSRESVEFFICHRKLADKKASLLGVAEVPLNEILRSASMGLTFELNVMDDHRSCGTLKVSFDLIGDHSVEDEDAVTEDGPLKATEEKKPERIEKVEPAAPADAHDHYDITTERQGSSIAISPSTSVLFMMLLVEEGIDLPGTTVISPTHGPSSHPPNVFLVFRTLAPGENEKTPIIWGESNPKFDFVQVSPLKLENALLSRMKNNFVIIEVWTRVTSGESHSDKLLGLVKISTHHFYQSLRDEEISRVVLKSQHPLISVDESVSVIDLFTGQERGKLQVTLALGTQAQIAMLRKVKSNMQGKTSKRQHHLEDKNTEHDSPPGGPVEHTFEMNIVRLDGFKPLDNQVWGETDCFIQYQFPTQSASDDTEVDASIDQENVQNLNFASMQNFRSDATLCVPDPVFNDARRHTFRPPPSLPVQRILLSSCYTDSVNGGIPFELWSRYYHPNVRDQLLAKGLLPIAKVSALVTMTTNKVSEQTFHVPLEFVDPEEMHDDSAGRLEVLVKYRASGTTLESTQPAMQFSKTVILRVGLLRACGLKAALKMACRHYDDDELKHAKDVGPNTYVKIKPTFLPDEDARTSRLVAQSFTPEYQHHVEIACPLVSYHRDVTPVSLAELLISGEVEFSVWHRSSAEDDGQCGREKDVLLGTFALSTRPLLRKSTGLHSWFSLETPERYRRNMDSHSDMGALEISVSFSHSSDLDSILRAGKAAGWSLPHFESRLLGYASATSDDVTKTEHVTFSVTVTNAWLPKHELLLHGRTSIDKSASAYLRYKFFDHDSVTSSLCPLVAKQPHSVETRFENLVSARIAHKKSFVCKRSRPLVWFLREEKLELQIWLTHTSAEKKRRPTDSDKLLGVCCVDLSTMDFAKEQHISGSFKLFRMGSDDLGDGKVRVYVSMKPGAIADPEPDPVVQRLHAHDSDEEVALSPKASTISLQAQVLESVSFPAVVTVERAMHLPLVGDLETDKHAEPNCYVSFEVVDASAVIGVPEHDMGTELKTVTMTTKMTMATVSPVWNEVSEVNLPRQLLSGAHGAFLLKVWHRDSLYLNQPEPAESAADYSKVELSASAAKVELMATDRMLGFATVDLSVLRAGLRDVNGWYNVLDIHGQCQGQLKVAVTPSKLPPPSEPASARTQDTKLDTGPELISTTMKFLNQAPVNIPIQTPSGSMYYPGLQSSAQTVKATCKMSETEELNFLQTHQQLSAFVPPLPQASNGPSASMFRYASSDRQQACLVNTLQKQIQELEEIKKRFQQRRAAGFGTSERENESQNLHADLGRMHEGVMQNSSENIEHSSDHQLQNAQRNGTHKNAIKAQEDSENLTNMTSSDSMGISNLREKKKGHVREQRSMTHDSLTSRPPRTSKVTYEKSDDDDDLENVSPRSTETLTSIPSDRPSPKVNRNDTSMNGCETVHDLHPNRTHAPPDLENVEVDRSNDAAYPTPSAGPNATFTHPLQSSEFTKTLTNAGHGNAVHLSLYEKRKSPEFGDHAFSDNEASSDVEFVQPRNLNEEHATDFREPHDKESDDEISDLEESAENPRHVPVPSALTPARSEGHSALENTSLWLSGSTLRVSGLSSDTEDDDQHKSESKSDKSQDAIPLKIDEFEEERSEKEELSHDSEEQILIPEDQEEVDEVDAETLPEDPAKSSPKPANVIVLEDEPDNHHSALSSHQENTESVADDYKEDDQCTEEEESLHLEDQTSDNSVPAFSDPSMNTADNRKNGKPVTVESSDVFKPLPKSELKNAAIYKKQEPTKNPVEGMAAHREGRENDENVCPNTLAKQRNVQPPRRGRLFPNFFPPTRDLEASMRALQEATTKHKHDLLKKKQSVKHEEKASPLKKTDIVKQTSPRTRKLPPKPEDFSDERTKRLARIFRTKFS